MYAYETIMAYSLFLTAVDVSFSETAVRVMEGDGRITLRLSVTGQLDRSVSVGLQVRSQDGTAIGESEVEKLCFKFLHYVYNYYLNLVMLHNHT